MRVVDEVERTIKERVYSVACDGCGKRAGDGVPRDWYTVATQKIHLEMHACTAQCAALCFGAYITIDANPSEWWLISRADAKVVADALDGYGAAHAAYVFGAGLNETNAEPCDFSSVPKPDTDAAAKKP